MKYLKDREDYDLDPEQLVSDVLLDEGKAARDGHDQEVIFTVIQEQGHAVRQGSVVPDLSLPHYQTRPRPPTRFPDTASSLGKRSYSTVEPPNPHTADKRSRLAEIPETQEDPVPTIEYSPELVRDTQHDPTEEEDIFDDAAESHEPDKQDRVASTSAHFPRTPSSGLLANGTNAGTASKFKNSKRRDEYAPSSDIEDSQMSPAKHSTTKSKGQAMNTIEAPLSGQSQKNDPVSNFDAQQALLPASPPLAPDLRKDSMSPVVNGAAKSIEESESEADSSSDSEKPDPAPLVIEKHRKTSASPKKAPPANAGKDTRLTSTAPDGKKRKRKQPETQTPYQPTAKDKKKQKVIDADVQPNKKLALPTSVSRRTSGIASELDSPGEQLSQSLWDTAKKGSLAESVKNVFEEKNAADVSTSKKQNKKKKSEETRESSSASASRPSSSHGVGNGASSNKETPKQQAVSGTSSKSSRKKKTLTEKIQDAKNAPAQNVVIASTKKVKTPGPKSGVLSHAANATPAPLNTKPKETKAVPSITKSGLPLPDWSSNPPDAKTPSAKPQSSFIVPMGMTEEDYLAQRAVHEATPQPPKVVRSHGKKEPTPAPQVSKSSKSAGAAPASEKKAASPLETPNAPAALDTAAKSAKKALERLPEAVTPPIPEQAAQVSSKGSKTNVPESSSESSSEEDSSSAESSPDEKKSSKKTASTKSSSKSDSRSDSPAVLKKSTQSTSTKSKDKAAMPPPTPKSTAKRRETMDKKHTDRASSSDRSGNIESKGESPSRSSAASSTSSTERHKSKSQQIQQATAAPAAPQKAPSQLKLLRQKVNSQTASKDGSPAPHAALVKRKPAPPPDSSSSDDDSSSDSDSNGKSSAKQGKRGRKSSVVSAKPDPTIRDVTPEDSDSSDDE